MTTCTVNKIDSNVTGLAFAEEVCLKQLPTLGADGFDPTWYGLEPNSYSNFGGKQTTVARQPISATRQRKKGTLVGLDASGAWNQDLTQSNLTRLMQGFFFANARQKPATQPFNGTQHPITSVATSDDSFNAASGLVAFLTGHLIKASGFGLNNGLHRVTTGHVAAKTMVATNLTDEAAPPAAAKLEAVGFQFAAGVMSITATAAAAVLALTGVAQATGVLTFSGPGTAADTVTIGTRVYTLVAALTGATDQVLIGADATATGANLAAAIDAVTGAGTSYNVGTLANTQVTAVSVAGVVTLTAINGGVASNSIATTEAGTNTSFSAATLTGGTGAASFLDLGFVPGEWVFVGGDDVATAFTQTSSTNRPGYARVSAVTNSSLTLDDTTWTPQTDAGTSKTIQLFFGTVIRNEPLSADIVTRSYNFERTLGHDDVGVQAEYLEGGIANEMKVNFPEGDKLNVDLSIVALDATTRTGTQGIKTGTRVAAPGETAFNTALDLYRVKMAIHDETAMNQDALFGFVESADLDIKNNAAPVKALGVLGAIDVSVGNFESSGTVTALFSTVEALAAIRANADIGLNFIAARANGGMVFDTPLLGLDTSGLAVALNTAIKLPLNATGAQNIHGFTALSDWFPYLPNVAMPV